MFLFKKYKALIFCPHSTIKKNTKQNTGNNTLQKADDYCRPRVSAGWKRESGDGFFTCAFSKLKRRKFQGLFVDEKKSKNRGWAFNFSFYKKNLLKLRKFSKSGKKRDEKIFSFLRKNYYKKRRGNEKRKHKMHATFVLR